MITVKSFGIIPLRKEEGNWKVLVILHKEGCHWGFPKGKANPDETAEQSAIRELKEETNLDVVQLLVDQPFVEQYQFRKKQEVIVKTVHYFPALVQGSLQLQQEELRDAKWVDLTAANEHLTFKQAKSICQRVCEFMKGK